MAQKETTSYEIFDDIDSGYCVEFYCPQCHKLLLAETDELEGGFDIRCDNCNSLIQCYFRLIMEWD